MRMYSRRLVTARVDAFDERHLRGVVVQDNQAQVTRVNI